MAARRLDAVADLDAVGWDSLVTRDDGFQSAAWLRVQCRIGASDIGFHVVERDGGAVAGLVSAWADEGVPWLLARPDAMLEAARGQDLPGAAELWPGRAVADLLPSLVCGGRHLGRTRPLRGPDATPGDVEALVAAAEDDARERSAATVCFPHVDERDDWLCSMLEERGYHWHASATLCWLDVPAGGFDAYLEPMTQHRRRRVRLERRHVAEGGVKVEHRPLAQAPLERLGELDAQLLAKYGNPASPDTSTRGLRLIAEEMGDAAMVSMARLDAEVIGFGLVVRSRGRDGEQWFGHRAGFDYEAQGELPLYYEVLYYSVLEQAALEGVRLLNAGVGSAHAKLARGCDSSTQRSYLLPLRDELR